MVIPCSPRKILATLALLWVPTPGHPARAAPDGFSVVELPPVATRLGDFISMDPIGIDHRGRVVGDAYLFEEESPGTFGDWTGFRFDPRSGVTSVIDPLDALHTDIYALSAKGTLFGEAEGRNFRARKLFVYSDENGFDFLRKRSKKWFRRGFLFSNVTDGGYVAGRSLTKRGKLTALVYHPENGWLDLLKRGASLPDYFENILVNDLGDYAIEAYPDVLVSFDGRKLERVPGPAGFEFFLEGLGANGEVTGYYTRPARYKFDAGGPPRPFVYTRQRGFIDLLPRAYTRGSAKWISKNGVIRGTARRTRAGDTVFSWHPVSGFDAVHLEEAFASTGDEREFRQATVVDVNDRGEFIAEVRVHPRPDSRCWGKRQGELFFYFDPEQGLVDLQQAVDEAGFDLEIFEVVDISDRGQVVARVCHDGATRPFPWSGVLFTPR